MHQIKAVNFTYEKKRKKKEKRNSNSFEIYFSFSSSIMDLNIYTYMDTLTFHRILGVGVSITTWY